MAFKSITQQNDGAGNPVLLKVAEGNTLTGAFFI